MTILDKIYPPEEKERLDKLRTYNAKLSQYLEAERKSWTVKLEPILKTIRGHLTPGDHTKIIDAQAMGLSYRQELNEEKAAFLGKLVNCKKEIDKLEQEKFLLFSTNIGLKPRNIAEVKLLMGGNLAENTKQKELYEAHIEYLRETDNVLSSFQFSIKNIISLFEYLGK